jgi:hypothetical protein
MGYSTTIEFQQKAKAGSLRKEPRRDGPIEREVRDRRKFKLKHL